MRRDRSLRRRIASAFAWMAVGVCIFFALVMFFFVQEIERHFLERRLLAVGRWQAGFVQQGASPAALPPGFGFYAGQSIPEDLAQLPPGYRELRRGKQALLVMKAAHEGVPYVVVDEIGDFRKIRREILLALAIGILGSGALAFVLGRITAGRVISPVTGLADAVEKDALGEHAPLVQRQDEIGVLARTFAARTEQLNGFLVRERLFTGDVSHELRTPLTVILGAAEVLSARFGSNSELATIVDRIQRTAMDTAETVAALLLLSRAPETLDRPRTELRPILEREAERSRPLLGGRDVQLVLDIQADVTVYARGELTAMAIGNLLRNACSYTEQGRVTVRLEQHQLIVQDTGPGLPPQVREHLFKRLVRSDAAGAGSGLGLSIAKRICDHLGWKIVAEEPASRGTRFVVRFEGT